MGGALSTSQYIKRAFCALGPVQEGERCRRSFPSAEDGRKGSQNMDSQRVGKLLWGNLSLFLARQKQTAQSTLLGFAAEKMTLIFSP